jgi:hypothetical protein
MDGVRRMKVFLVSLNESGDIALNKLLGVWKGKERFRILRTMGNRVHFTLHSAKPLTVFYDQVDFRDLPIEGIYCRRIKLAAYASLEVYGVNPQNVEVQFQ